MLQLKNCTANWHSCAKDVDLVKKKGQIKSEPNTVLTYLYNRPIVEECRDVYELE
jgi:hypothetical protein